MDSNQQAKMAAEPEPRDLPHATLVASLRAQLQRCETSHPLQDTQPISSGCKDLDHILPGGGLPRGGLVECFAKEPEAGGASMFALLLACQAAREGGAIVVVDPWQRFYPPAAALWGLDLQQMVVVHPQAYGDQIWALDQSLRCPAVAAVWTSLECLEERDFRRLQLAAEQGGVLGLLTRSFRQQRAPSWSELRLTIHPQVVSTASLCSGRSLRIEVTRCRQGRSGGALTIEIDEATGALRRASRHHETSPVHPVSQLAHSAARGGSSRA